ncbi:hypothetical protein Gotri_025855 [Gossypium trilobum]|uniref:Uncharacterized protein n=1 Tax=Gossypium trilobum TaxID=34281 RepID=A0A7J9FQN4_9ROSI|nr:hypothetical protein [Gossypium trilobum]
MDAKMMFPRMRWMFQLHNHNPIANNLEETITVDAKMMFPWMRWMSHLHNRNHQAKLRWSIASEKVPQESAQKSYLALCEVEGLTEDKRYRALSKIPNHQM